MDAPQARSFIPITLICVLFASLVLLSGCLIKSEGGIGQSLNQSNLTAGATNSTQNQNASSPQNPANTTLQNTTNPSVSGNATQNATIPSTWARFYFPDFSFEYPMDMKITNSSGLFAGQHDLDDTTGEVMVVYVIDTAKTYGDNYDKDYQSHPTQAAADFLTQDKKNDPAGLLDKAYQYGNLTTYAFGRDAYAAELPFDIHFQGFQNRYTGYAISIYVPERSKQVRIRIIALDPAVADAIRTTFTDTFRMEGG